MQKLTTAGLLCLSLMSVSMPAQAKGVGGGFFGAQDNIHKIQDIELKGQDNESLYLGYMTKSYFLIGGVYMKDAGYVIGINNNDEGYYPMPEGAELKTLQDEGMLPDPLPEYKIPLKDYLFGFSLWIALPIILLLSKLFGGNSN